MNDISQKDHRKAIAELDAQKRHISRELMNYKRAYCEKYAKYKVGQKLTVFRKGKRIVRNCYINSVSLKDEGHRDWHPDIFKDEEFVYQIYQKRERGPDVEIGQWNLESFKLEGDESNEQDRP